MRKIFFISVFLSFLATAGQAQSSKWDTDLYGVTLKDIGSFRKGTEIHISSIMFFRAGDENSLPEFSLFDHFELTVNGENVGPYINKTFSGIFRFDCSTVQNVWDATVIDNILDDMIEKGFRHNLRQEADLRSRRYIKLIKEHNLLLDDPEIQHYANQLLNRLIPGKNTDVRTFHHDIMLIQDPACDSFMFPNGTLVLSTGLLTTIHTIDELAAVMAREVAHLILDHAIQNYHISHFKQILLGSVTTFITDLINTFTGFSMSSSSEYYSPGTISTSDISLIDGIMTAATKELGLGYTREQDRQCDAIAFEILRAAGFDTDALSTVLWRQKQVLQKDRKFVRTLAGYEPIEVEDRCLKYGKPALDIHAPEYEIAISSAATTQAQMMYNEHYYPIAERLIRQNMSHHIYSDDDCIVLANTLLALYDTDDICYEVLSLVSSALEMKEGNVQAYRPRILAMIRLGRFQDALDELEKYYDALDAFLATKDNIKGTSLWEPYYLYVVSERGWILKTKAKLRGEISNAVPDSTFSQDSPSCPYLRR